MLIRKYKKLLLANLAILLAIFFALPQITLAGYLDNESANGNEFSASSLDAEATSTQTELFPAATSASMVPGTSVSRDANIENIGEEDFQYKVEFEKVSGSDELCDVLQVQAEKNSVVVYNNDLFDFTIDGGTLNLGNDDDWDFTITMPLGTSHNIEGLDCDFNFKFIAWQTSFPAPTQGWIDEEDITGNEITAGDWEPIISGVGNTDPLDTKGATNNDMSKVSVSWSTDESATSNVVYDIATHLACVGYASFSLPVDATADSTDHEVTLSNLSAGTTYYYRAVSEDSGGNAVCSDEYSFDIPVSSADAPTNDIVLNEFVPNPFGVDSADKPNGEWVELYNKSGADVGVNGWYIYDSTNANGVQITNAKTDTGGTTVPANGWLVVYIEKAYFNNNGDTVKLYSDVFASGVLIDSHAYAGAVPEGKSFARFPDGVGVWIDPDTTPGKENQMKEEELKQFRETAFIECFDAEGNVKKSKNDICQKEFLEYLGMLDNKKDKKISSEMQILLLKTEEIIEEVKPVEEDSVKEDVVPIETEIKIEEVDINVPNSENLSEKEIVEPEKVEVSINIPAETIAEESEEKLPDAGEPKEEIRAEEPKKDAVVEEKKTEEIPKDEEKSKEEMKKEEAKIEEPVNAEDEQKTESSKMN